MNSELQITEDGSYTLFVPELNECYHSTHGAVQESQHIFIEAAFNQCNKEIVNVLEIGFGTGLNAFLCMIAAKKSGKKVNYISLEKNPVSVDKAMMLNYPMLVEPTRKNYFEVLHTSAWNIKHTLTSFFDFEKLEVDFLEFNHIGRYDVIFFDAFSPEKQPEMWTEQLFKNIFDNSNPNAILTTYCAKGVVRRALQSAGFIVERLPGPPGKREILRAVKK